jgi:mannosyltransferase
VRTAALLLPVFLVALLPRALGVGDRSFWLDEAETMEAALAEDVGALHERVATVEIGKGPGYYLMLRAWSRVFGTGEVSLRLPSVLLGALAAAFAALWALWLWREERRSAHLPALFTGLIVALHPFLVHVSRDARSYALSHAALFLAGALTVPAFLGVRSRGVRVAAGAGVAAFAALGVSSHLYGVFLVAGLLLACGLLVREDGPALRRLLLVAAGFAALIALQAPLTLRQLEFRAMAGGVEQGITLRDAAHSLLQVAGEKPAGVVLVLLGAASAVLGRRLRAVRFSVVLLGAPLLAALAIEFLVRPVLVHGAARYLAASGGALALLCGGLLARTTAVRAAGALAVVAVLVFGVVSARAFEKEYSEDWRRVAATLREDRREGDVVICHRPWVERPLRLYYDGELLGRLPYEELQGRTVPRVEDLRFHAQPVGRVYLVWSHAGDFEGAPRTYFEKGLGPAREVHSQFAIKVYRFDPFRTR